MKRALVVAVSFVDVNAGASAQLRQWNFTVLLYGDPIGAHRSSLTEAGMLRMSSEAGFRVRLLGVPVHQWTPRRETWRCECLDGLTADTDDDVLSRGTMAYSAAKAAGHGAKCRCSWRRSRTKLRASTTRSRADARSSAAVLPLPLQLSRSPVGSSAFPMWT